jgi:hypothetical protein
MDPKLYKKGYLLKGTCRNKGTGTWSGLTRLGTLAEESVLKSSLPPATS